MTHEGLSAPMVYVSNYDFVYITDKTVKPEESFINSYVNECLESDSTIISTLRMRIIIDDNYEKDDLNKVMAENIQHLNSTEHCILLNILNKSEYMFSGTFDTWNTTPVHLELKDDANHVCLRPYPVPRVHEVIFIKEVKILVSLGILEEGNDSKWGAPSFAQPKARTNRIRFLSDFWNLNR